MTKMVRETFQDNEEVTLCMLYKKALKLDSEKDTASMKHTIRSIVHNMKKQNKIKSIAPSTYQKI